jgi:hypothetical protein
LVVGGMPEEALESSEGASDLHIKVDEAIIGISRAVFAEGGRLVFSGDPFYSFLVATVAAEYQPPSFAEEKGFQGEEPADTRSSLAILCLSRDDRDREIHHLDEMEAAGYARVLRDASINRVVSETLPVAMVCIGGSADNTVTAARAFQEFRRGMPIFALQTTGAATRTLQKMELRGFRVADNEEILGHFRRTLAERYEDRKRTHWEEETRLDIPPYPFIMQDIVHHLAEPDERRAE